MLLTVAYVVVALILIILSFIIIKKLLCRENRQRAAVEENLSRQSRIEVQPARDRNRGLTGAERNITVHVPNSSTRQGQQKEVILNVPKSNKNTSIYLILEDDKTVPTTEVRRESIPGTSNTNAIAARNFLDNTFPSAPLLKKEYSKQPPCNPSFDYISKMLPTAPTAAPVQPKNTNTPKKQSATSKSVAQKPCQLRNQKASSQNTNKKISPKLLIYHIRSFRLIDETEFIKKLILHNNITHYSVNISIVKKIPRGDLFNIIIEVDPKTREILLKTGQVYIDKMRYKIEDSFYVMQCYKCASFGHINDNCKRDKFSCSTCARNHSTKDCTSTTACCINCKTNNDKFKTDYNTEHSAKYRKCPLYEEQIDRIKSKTNYEYDDDSII